MIFKSKELLVVDKPPDVRIDGDFAEDVVTVERWVKQHHPELVADPAHKIRFCHQLDHATSGVLCLAFRKAMAARVTHCFESRTTTKMYLALVHGIPTQPTKDHIFTFSEPIAEDPTDESGFKMCAGKLKTVEPNTEDGVSKRRRVDLPSGRHALTHAMVVKSGVLSTDPAQSLEVSLVLLAPSTGRRHQLRIHCLEWGHPIVGDVCYHPEDKERSVPRMMLHAWRLWLPISTEGTDGQGAREKAQQKAQRRTQKNQAQKEHKVKNTTEPVEAVLPTEAQKAVLRQRVAELRAGDTTEEACSGVTEGTENDVPGVGFAASNRLSGFVV